jgi:hypothetical protein
MSTILQFRMPEDGTRRSHVTGETEGEVVIFPGVRIERHNLDLGYRLRDSAGRDRFDGIGDGGRPRKTS